MLRKEEAGSITVLYEFIWSLSHCTKERRQLPL